MPDFSLEKQCAGLVCGLDEVGRGPLSGPVTAACVYIPNDVRDKGFIAQINDSKKLSVKKRNTLYPFITEYCIWGIGEASVEEIDRINILQASLLAMRRAYSALGQEMHHALVDGNRCPSLPCPSSLIIKGDSISTSIAAASILAKVSRDTYMQKIHEEFPYYGWNSNAGYGAKVHIEALMKYGATKYHRTSFAPVRRALELRPHARTVESA